MDHSAPAHPSSDYRYLRLPEVVSLVGLSRSMLYQLIAAGRFPSPVRLSAHSSGWRSDAVRAWMDSRQPAQPATAKGHAGCCWRVEVTR